MCPFYGSGKLSSSRREFLKSAGLVACGAAVTAISAGSCRRAETKYSESSPTQSVSATEYNYIPPADMPPLVAVPGSTFRVAADRRYSLEHIWVLPGSQNTVVLGISEKLVLLLSGPYGIDLPLVGSTFKKGDGFGYIEGFKVFVDLVCPVSGSVISVNQDLISQQVPFDQQSESGEPIPALVNDTYRSGWMFVLLLSSPDELKELMTWEEYVALCSKNV
jgi:glycine cleavage system H protein